MTDKNQRRFITTMTKPFVIFSALLLLAGSAVAQESKGFSFPEEREDSLSSLAIMPVKRPKELLMQVAERIELALQQRHGARKYRIKSSYKFDYDSIPPLFFPTEIKEITERAMP